MKALLVVIVCMVASKSFSQTNEMKLEEKSSDWIKIAAVTTAAKPRTTTVAKKKASTKRTLPPKQDAQDEFEKTNNEVNRFKKPKQD